jgi:hypothetical protein
MTPAPFYTEAATFEALVARLRDGDGADRSLAIEQMIDLSMTGSSKIRMWARNYLVRELHTTIEEPKDEAASETGRLP